MILHQFFDTESSTFTYLIASFRGADALIIDPVQQNIAEYVAILKQESLRLIYTLDSHTHDDHISGTSMLRKETSCMTLAHELTNTGKYQGALKMGI